jgi:hypothetical protein
MKDAGLHIASNPLEAIHEKQGDWAYSSQRQLVGGFIEGHAFAVCTNKNSPIFGASSAACAGFHFAEAVADAASAAPTTKSRLVVIRLSLFKRL